MKGEQRKKEASGFLVVELSKLKNGMIAIEREVPSDWLERRMQFCEYEAHPTRATVKLEIRQMETGVLVQGRVSSTIQASCGICLKEISIAMEPELSTYLVPRAAVSREIDGRVLTPEDLDREYYDGDVVVLDELIGDAIMLEMPMNPKCGDGCPGLMALETNGIRPEIDPRLAPLADIRLNKEN